MSDYSKSDLRGASQDYKRAATHRAKWAHGIHTTTRLGRDAAHPRPERVSDHAVPAAYRQRVSGSALKAAQAKKRDMDAAHDEYPVIARKLPSLASDDSASSADEDYLDDHFVLDEGLVHGATVDRAPSSGSQVLTSALAKAIEAFEDKETVRLVRSEWSVLDDDGEEMGLSPVKKARGKKDNVAMIEGEDEYELV